MSDAGSIMSEALAELSGQITAVMAVCSALIATDPQRERVRLLIEGMGSRATATGVSPSPEAFARGLHVALGHFRNAMDAAEGAERLRDAPTDQEH